MSQASNAHPPFQRLPAHQLAIWLAGPIAAIIIVSALTAAWLVKYSADRIDAAQLENENRLARTAFTAVSEFAQRAASDYAHWDETYDQLKGKPDLEWAVTNLGPNFASSFGTTHTFVFDAQGAMRYASIPVDGAQAQFTWEGAKELAGFELDELRRAAMRAIVAGQSDVDAVEEGFLYFQGALAFAAIRPIRPSSEARIATDQPFSALVVLKALDAPKLLSMSQSYGLSNLVIAEKFTIPLQPLNADTPRIGASWTHSKQGAAFAQDTVRQLLPLGLAALLLIALTGVGWWRAVASVRASELQALEDRAKSVQDTARAKSLFVANMSHELRTPLNAIIGFSEVLKEQMLGPIHQPKYVEYANDVHASGKHLLGIVNNILTLSKIDAQQQRIQIEDVSVKDAVSDAMRMITPDAAKRRVRIETDFTGSPVARADVQALIQIAVNLLSNAVKFSPPDSVVDLKVFERLGSIIMTVEDRGAGIPKETLSQLGRPFTQAEDPYRRNHQGTGLGLSICFALARQMNGELRIESQEGQGTTGTLELPGAQAAQDHSTRAPRAA